LLVISEDSLDHAMRGCGFAGIVAQVLGRES